MRRAGPPRRFSRMPSRGRFVLLVGALLVLLVAVASATYLLLHDQPAPRPHSGALTVTAGGYTSRSSRSARRAHRCRLAVPGRDCVWPARGSRLVARWPPRCLHARCDQRGQPLIPGVAHPRHRHGSRHPPGRGARARVRLPSAGCCRLVARRHDARLRLFRVPREVADLARRGGWVAPPAACDGRPRCELADLVARRNPPRVRGFEKWRP